MYNLSEVRFFLNQLNIADDVFIISDDVWANAKRELINKYRNSTQLEVCVNIIKDFETTHPKKKYISDLEVFIRESKLEDFFHENVETISVSTIHKSKGKEFDNVFLLLEKHTPTTDEAKRQLYVAMTRAKQNLTVHLNSNFLDSFSSENLERIEDREIYLPPKEMAIHLAHKDVWLDYFINRQYLLSQLMSGDALTLNGEECLNSNGQSILKFSRQFLSQIEKLKERNYKLKSVKVNFLVYWLKQEAEQEVKIILPELCFEKQQIED